MFGAARANAGALRKVDAELVDLGLLDKRQAQQARLIPFARAHLGAKYKVSNETRATIEQLRAELAASTNATEQASLRGKIGALAKRRQLVDREGNALPPEVLEDLRQRLGAEPTGFVSQSPSARGAGSFYRGFFPDRQTVGKAKRSGKATSEGTFDPSFNAVAEQLIRGQGIVDATKGFDRTVREFAVGGRRFEDFKAAQEAARHPEGHGMPADLPLRPVRLAPFRASSRETSRAEQIFDQLEPSNQRGMEQAVDGLLESALADGPGPVVLLPEQVVSRLREHLQAATTTRRVAQVVGSGFKGVVLPLSPNWVLGNIVDVSMRSMISGTVPWGRDARLGRKVLREVDKLDPDEAARVRAGLVPGTLFSAAESTHVFRDARQFAGTSLAPLARAMGTLRRTPGVRQTVNLYARYRDGVFSFNEKFIERQSQYAQLGKQARRDVRQSTGKWHRALRLGDDAVHDLAKGLLKSENQIRYAKAIEEVLGQWTANSPGARAFLVDYAPFGMWTRAATKFALWTLPAKHPIKTAFAAAAYEMTEKERDALGLSQFADRPLPPSVQGSIPLGDGRLLAPQSITTFGFFADYQSSLASSVLPQLPLQELAGLDWTGDKLTHEDGTPLRADERAGAALLSMSEAYVPFIAMGQKIAKDGPSGLLPRATKPYPGGLVDWLRDQSTSRQITVPAHPSSESSTTSASSPEPDPPPWIANGSAAPEPPAWYTAASAPSGPPAWYVGAQSAPPWVK